MGVLNRAAVASVRLGRPWPNATVCTISFFDIFFIVGQKGGGGFYVGFLKNGTSIFYGSSVRMGHKITYILYLYTTLPLHYACQDSHIDPGFKLPLCWQPAAARAASHEMTRATKKGLT